MSFRAGKAQQNPKRESKSLRRRERSRHDDAVWSARSPRTAPSTASSKPPGRSASQDRALSSRMVTQNQNGHTYNAPCMFVVSACNSSSDEPFGPAPSQKSTTRLNGLGECTHNYNFGMSKQVPNLSFGTLMHFSADLRGHISFY